MNHPQAECLTGNRRGPGGLSGNYGDKSLQQAASERSVTESVAWNRRHADSTAAKGNCIFYELRCRLTAPGDGLLNSTTGAMIWRESIRRD